MSLMRENFDVATEDRNTAAYDRRRAIEIVRGS